jgi:formate hydrogenlyase subunit 3/multisubunit Na+/H+ antiporter MnhD subunit
MTLLWLVALPLAMALVVLLLRELPIIAAPLSAATLIVVAILCLTEKQASQLIILGRSISLLPLEAMGLAFCAIILALVTIYAYRIPQGSWANSLTLLAMGFFAAAIMVRNATIAGLLLEVGAIAAILLIPSERVGSSMCSMRILVLITLSGLLLLLAAWALESRAIDPDNGIFANVGTVTLALGFGIALAIAPFHVWLPPVFQYGTPLGAVMISVVFSAIVLLRLSSMLQVSMWPGGREFFSALLLGGGTLTALVGGLTAMPQRTVNRALAYSALADTGLVVVGLGIGTRAAVNLATMHLAYRGIAIVVVSMSLGILHQCLDGDDILHLSGAIRRAPLAVIGMMIGGFSLAGLPLTAGFTTRLLLYRAYAAQHAPWTVAIIACSLGPAWAFTRCVVAALVSTPVAGGRREPLLPGLLTLALSLLLLALGVYPNLLTLLAREWATPLAAALHALHG